MPSLQQVWYDNKFKHLKNAEVLKLFGIKFDKATYAWWVKLNDGNSEMLSNFTQKKLDKLFNK